LIYFRENGSRHNRITPPSAEADLAEEHLKTVEHRAIRRAIEGKERANVDGNQEIIEK